MGLQSLTHSIRMTPTQHPHRLHRAQRHCYDLRLGSPYGWVGEWVGRWVGGFGLGCLEKKKSFLFPTPDCRELSRPAVIRCKCVYVRMHRFNKRPKHVRHRAPREFRKRAALCQDFLHEKKKLLRVGGWVGVDDEKMKSELWIISGVCYRPVACVRPPKYTP